MELLASGMSQTEAYLGAGYRCTAKHASKGANQLLGNPEVAAALARLQREAAERAAMSRDELVAWLCNAVRVPVGGIDEEHPLAQEVTRDYRGGEVSRVKVKSVSKMDAAKLLVAMLGWMKGERREPEGKAEMLWEEALREMGEGEKEDFKK
ncbi:hypothetical protein llg_26980 [Luteolibacter sp. LG18]|nr:hypothetical protein llg_26980 [Luteolibacter sp. LG18]